MDITKTIFRRQFSMSMYKNKKLLLGEMSFSKDFVSETKRGDLYPVIERSDDCKERVAHNRYRVWHGSCERMLGQFFPYATYALTGTGRIGFGFAIQDAKVTVIRAGREVVCCCNGEEQRIEARFESDTMLVSCRPGAFDVYFVMNDCPEYVHTFSVQPFANAHLLQRFSQGYTSVIAVGDAEIVASSFYIDSGVSLADIRPIRYENGDAMIEQGKMFFTASIRMQAEMFQGVFSWVPGTADVQLTGALFYDAGDGLWCGDVAASVLYHRQKHQWLLWVCSFNHGHRLAHAAFEGDPRFGVNVIDIEVMEKAEQGMPMTAFSGFEGDEDPDFFYDEDVDKWFMAVCRLDPTDRKYRYVFFESDTPFENYTCIGMGQPGEETGGSFVKVDGKQHFICGNSFSKIADYRIYRVDGMHNAHFDFSDGGFRGWGTVIPVKQGSRVRYYWLTFDRHNGSDYNWSYGNFYCFEAR